MKTSCTWQVVSQLGLGDFHKLDVQEEPKILCLALIGLALLKIQVVSAAEMRRSVFSENMSACYWLKFQQTKFSTNYRQLFSQKTFFFSDQQQKQLGSSLVLVSWFFLFTHFKRSTQSSTCFVFQSSGSATPSPVQKISNSVDTLRAGICTTFTGKSFQHNLLSCQHKLKKTQKTHTLFCKFYASFILFIYKEVLLKTSIFSILQLYRETPSQINSKRSTLPRKGLVLGIAIIF